MATLWGEITGSITNQIDLVNKFLTKSNIGHSHAQTEIINLISDMSGKSDVGHYHQRSDIINLDTDIAVIENIVATKSDVDHKHNWKDLTTGDVPAIIEDQINSKANINHTHSESSISGLDNSLSGKSDVGHSHSIDDIVRLDNTLLAKANVNHTHQLTTNTTPGFLPAYPNDPYKFLNGQGQYTKPIGLVDVNAGCSKNSASVVSVNVDDTSIEINSENNLQIKHVTNDVLDDSLNGIALSKNVTTKALDVNSTKSIVVNTDNQLQLDGDVASPGNRFLYGTDETGKKCFIPLVQATVITAVRFDDVNLKVQYKSKTCWVIDPSVETDWIDLIEAEVES